MSSRAGYGHISLSSVLPLALILVPVLAQTLPIPRGTIERFAPANAAFIQRFEFGLGSSPLHSTSIVPGLTLTSLIFLVTGTLWVTTLSRALGRVFKPRDLVQWLVWAGLILALQALVQAATFNGKIYWLWESRFGVANNYFGPFVNRNHFAGWLLLALALTTGYFLGSVAIIGRLAKPSWRQRLLWLGSEQASVVVLTAAALSVMAVSLVWSLSRSGIAGGALALCILGIATIVRMRRGAKRSVAAASIMLLLGTAAVWKGIDFLASWYENTRTLEWRFTLWRDSLPALRDFWTLGSGLNTYGQVMLLYPQTDASVQAQQAHNDYLQLAIEGGLLIVVPWAVAAVVVARRAVARLREPQDEMTWWIRMGAVAGICGMALQEVSEFSLQIPAVALLFATLLAVAIHEPVATPIVLGVSGNVHGIRRSRARHAGAR